MNHRKIIARLQTNANVFDLLFQEPSAEEFRWKPAPDRWSLLEVVNHLYDEEREDFRRRIALVLEDAEAPWPPIDPEGWVRSRRYNEREAGESLENFFAERRNSIAWLNGLTSPNWQATHHHPQLGPLSAEQLLANWLAHDLFHIRQINDLHFALLSAKTAPLSLGYSGWQ